MVLCEKNLSRNLSCSRRRRNGKGVKTTEKERKERNGREKKKERGNVDVNKDGRVSFRRTAILPAKGRCNRAASSMFIKKRLKAVCSKFETTTEQRRPRDSLASDFAGNPKPCSETPVASLRHRYRTAH